MDMEEREMDDVYKLVDIFCKKDPLIDGKTVLRSGYLKEDSLPSPFVSKRKLKKMRRKEREKSVGAKWSNLPAKDMTKKITDDLSVLGMRNALYPKPFYKKNDVKTLPKFFQKEREKSAGAKWSNLPAKDMTKKMTDDLSVLGMRNALYPKPFYKKNDVKTLPKFFQIGTIVESPADFYNSRIPKK